jgi:hypothetical protein
MPWPQAMAGVVGCARHPTTPRWPLPALPLLIQGGDFSQPIFTYVAPYNTYGPCPVTNGYQFVAITLSTRLRKLLPWIEKAPSS